MNFMEIYETQSNVLFISSQAAACSNAVCLSGLTGDVQTWWTVVASLVCPQISYVHLIQKATRDRAHTKVV